MKIFLVPCSKVTYFLYQSKIVRIKLPLKQMHKKMKFLPRVGGVAAEGAEDCITRFTEEKLLGLVGGAFGDDVPSLTLHEVDQLIDQETGRQTGYSAAWNLMQLPTDWTAETARLHRLQRERGSVKRSLVAQRAKCSRRTCGSSAIRSRHSEHTVCEHDSSFGLLAPWSYGQRHVEQVRNDSEKSS